MIQRNYQNLPDESSESTPPPTESFQKTERPYYNKYEIESLQPTPDSSEQDVPNYVSRKKPDRHAKLADVPTFRQHLKTLPGTHIPMEKKPVTKFEKRQTRELGELSDSLGDASLSIEPEPILRQIQTEELGETSSGSAHSKIFVPPMSDWGSGQATPRVAGGRVSHADPVGFLRKKSTKNVTSAAKGLLEEGTEPFDVVKMKDHYANRLWPSKQAIALSSLRDERYRVLKNGEVLDPVVRIDRSLQPRLRRHSDSFRADSFYDSEVDAACADVFRGVLLSKHDLLNMPKRPRSTLHRAHK